jgi:hypothetical protein
MSRWAKRASEVFHYVVEEYSASVFEVYFDRKFKPHVELKRHFKTVGEAMKYVEEARYLDEEGRILDPREFLIYMKYALRIHVWNYASTTVVLVAYTDIED